MTPASAATARTSTERTPYVSAKAAQAAGRSPLEGVLAPDAGEPDQDEREHRVAGGRRIVVQVLPVRDELLAVGGRQEEAAPLVVGEELHSAQRESPRRAQPAQVAGGDVQLNEAIGDVRVIVQVR